MSPVAAMAVVKMNFRRCLILTARDGEFNF
jgi:hypothetical protein